MSVLDDLDPTAAFSIWGYDLRGPDVLEVSARIAEEGGNADLNGRPLWDHPEWLEGWFRDGVPWVPALHHALPYAPGQPWNLKGTSDQEVK